MLAAVKLGGQSIRHTSKSSAAASHRSRTVLREMPFWMASMSISQSERSLGTMPRPPGSFCTRSSAMMHLEAKRSEIVGLSVSAPRKSVRLCCGSASMQSTRFPRCRSSAARFTVVVVFAVPPFRLIIAIVLMMSSCFHFSRFLRLPKPPLCKGRWRAAPEGLS